VSLDIELAMLAYQVSFDGSDARVYVDSVTGNTITLTSGLSSPAWDTAKRYRVIYDTYGDAQASQLLLDEDERVGGRR
jgi:hypothetical protein